MSVFVAEIVEAGNEESTAQQIAQCNRQQIAKQETGERHFCTQKHAQGNIGHVGDAVFKAGEHKQHDREPDSQDLAAHLFGTSLEPAGQNDQDIAQHTARRTDRF